MVFPAIANHFDAFIEEEEGSINGSSSLNILDLQDEFWALTVGPLGCPEAPTVFATSENQFRRYNQSTGIYAPITESAVVGQIMSNLELCADFLPPRLKLPTFIALKNRQRLKSVVDRARDLLAVDDDFFQDHRAPASRPGSMEC